MFEHTERYVKKKYGTTVTIDRRRQAIRRAMVNSRLYLKEWLQHRGIKQAQLVKWLNVSKGQISDLANGRQPYSKRWLDLFADALNCEPAQLLAPPMEASPDNTDITALLRDADNLQKALEIAFRRKNLDPKTSEGVALIVHALFEELKAVDVTEPSEQAWRLVERSALLRSDFQSR